MAEEKPASGQVPDQMETVMHKLVDMSSRLQATEDRIKEMREKVTTWMLSPATSCVDRSWTWACCQQFTQASDLSKAVGERVVKRLYQLPSLKLRPPMRRRSQPHVR